MYLLSSNSLIFSFSSGILPTHYAMRAVSFSWKPALWRGPKEPSITIPNYTFPPLGSEMSRLIASLPHRRISTRTPSRMYANCASTVTLIAFGVLERNFVQYTWQSAALRGIFPGNFMFATVYGFSRRLVLACRSHHLTSFTRTVVSQARPTSA